jgi:hypothetical protein
VRQRPFLIPALLALALGACADAATAPLEPPAAAARAPSLALQGEPLASLQTALTDARSRLLPALGDAAGQAALGEALARADHALAANDARALAAALRAVRAAATAERAALAPAAEAGPDLDALLLVLDGLEAAVPASLTSPAVTDAP